jgi:antitoxin (DNA-binding transcriptional repressor) of toxin-antitoxin stability system
VSDLTAPVTHQALDLQKSGSASSATPEKLTSPTPGPPSKAFCIIPTFVVTLFSEVNKMKFVGVREFKQDVVKYLNEGNEIVVMKHKKPIARLTPVQKNSAEIVLLEIGRILAEAGISKKEALKALDRARREIYG